MWAVESVAEGTTVKTENNIFAGIEEIWKAA
jgi:hypothetical protein